MAGYQTSIFSKHDDYMTPKSAWENIKEYIPENQVIWEAFYGDGQSGKDLTDMGFNVIHEPIDFFENNFGTLVLSNPPYTLASKILERLKELDKPFILLMPQSKIFTQYFRKLFNNHTEPIQLIIPRKRIQFKKIVNGVPDPNQKNSCNFDCFYYCWKIGLERDITFID